MTDISSADAIKFMSSVSSYFEARPTSGEDMAHWSNIYNAENAIACARLVKNQADRIAELEAALKMAGDDFWYAHKTARLDALHEAADRLRIMGDMGGMAIVRDMIDKEPTP